MRRSPFLILLLLVVWIGVLIGPGQPASADVSEMELQEIHELWQTSAHALADVNCSSCHLQGEPKAFVAQPNHESCQSCHESSVDTFLLGKHGIRLLEGQSPLTPAMARLPMKADVHNRQMNCNACHNVHSVNTVQASVDSCLSCHNDTHSLNYENSKHAELFAEDKALPRPSNQSVSCATCHLPRQNIGSDSTPNVVVNHNNTFTLLPRDRMVSEVCMNCHGMEYAYNSIFDDELVTQNFTRPPSLQLQTLDMVRVLEAKRSGGSTGEAEGAE
ncbi:MAG: hypothetical protein AAFU78_07100 [Cyanobacteria bacterium J06633_2]